jgi:hypothetical protein
VVGLTALLALCVFVATALADSPPTITVDQPGAVTATTAHVSGTVNPEGGPSTTHWTFEYTHELNGFFTVWTPSVGGELAGTEAEGTTPVPVGGTIEGLEPESQYWVRLFAENEFNPVWSQAPYPSFTTAAAAPEIQNASVEPLFGEALFTAQVNPGGNATYHVEYGATTAYGQSTPSRSLKAGLGAQSVKIGIFGLTSGTIYHARLVVENATGPVASLDQEFTTSDSGTGSDGCSNEASRAGSGSQLPECRAYEMVSPVDKFGNDAGAPNEIPKFSLSSPDGNTVLYGSRGPMGQPVRGLEDYAIGRRTPSGWTSVPAQPETENERVGPFQFTPYDLMLSPDFSSIAFMAQGSYVKEVPNIANAIGVYKGGTDGGAVSWLTKPQIADPIPVQGQNYWPAMGPIGGSPDLSTIYMWSGPLLLPSDAARRPYVEQWLEQGNLPEAPWELYEYSAGHLTSAGTLPDGTVSPGGAAPANARSANRAVLPGVHLAEVAKHDISEDGETLFFVSPDPRQTLEAVTSEPFELYVRRNGRSTLVSHLPDGSPAPLGAAAVGAIGPNQDSRPRQFMYGAADGSAAIFWSKSALASNAPEDGEIKAYRYEVATNSVTYLPGIGSDSITQATPDLSRFLVAGPSGTRLWNEGTIQTVGPEVLGTPASVSTDGNVFVATGGTSGQIYRYEVSTNDLVCASCMPNGGASGPVRTAGTNLETGLQAQHLMSSDGSRIFFDTPDRLVPRDTNGTADVYEWTPTGVHLISTGTSHEPSFVLDAGVDGSNIFFATAQGIDPEDTDNAYDVYDARVDGGFAGAEERARCEGDACQGHGSQPPSLPRPGSTLSGSGNGHTGPSGKLRAGPRRVTGKTLKVQVTLPAAGTVRARGTGIRSVKRSYRSGGKHQVTVPLNRAAKRSLAAGRSYKLKVRLRFSSNSGMRSTVTFVLRAKG